VQNEPQTVVPTKDDVIHALGSAVSNFLEFAHTSGLERVLADDQKPLAAIPEYAALTAALMVACEYKLAELRANGFDVNEGAANDLI